MGQNDRDVGKDFSRQRIRDVLCIPRQAIGAIGNMRIRNDNETQLVCSTVEEFLAMMNIDHDCIHHRIPKEDVHIESFNSILEREVIKGFELESFGIAEATINRFVEFYNNERIHSTIWYRTPGRRIVNGK